MATPEGLVRRTLKKKKRRNDDLTKEGERVPCLPYIKGLSETLKRVCRPLEVRIRHKATNTLRSLLTRIKTPLPETQKTGVIYEIPCRCGQVYIGETCKTFTDRMKEHKRLVQSIDTNNSIAVHVKKPCMTSHGKMLRYYRKNNTHHLPPNIYLNTLVLLFSLLLMKTLGSKRSILKNIPVAVAQ